MAKHRKTLEQKKIADFRHKFYSFDQVRLGSDPKHVPFLKTNTVSKIKNDPVSLTTVNKYPYLLHDILKTGVLTLSIIGIQLILFVLLKNKILALPIASY